MALSPGGAKAKGSRFEREVAGRLGGKRTPLSGGSGGNDVTIPSGSIWADWGIECKARGKLSWTVIWQALGQAAMAKRQNQKPAAVVKEDRGPAYFVCYLDDLVRWAEALSQVGEGHKIKGYVRNIERVLEEMKEHL